MRMGQPVMHYSHTIPISKQSKSCYFLNKIYYLGINALIKYFNSNSKSF